MRWLVMIQSKLTYVAVDVVQEPCRKHSGADGALHGLQVCGQRARCMLAGRPARLLGGACCMHWSLLLGCWGSERTLQRLSIAATLPGCNAAAGRSDVLLAISRCLVG
jgi:hypothetical protein